MTRHPTRMIRMGVLTLLLGFLPLLTDGIALDAKQVFERVGPSTVLIQSIDGQGSGVVLNEKGLILTNHHVVASNMNLKIRCKVRVGQRVIEKEISDVSL